MEGVGERWREGGGAGEKEDEEDEERRGKDGEV